MARNQLNKGERDGIRLLADLFVIKDLTKNVLEKDKHISPHLKDLDIILKKAVPKVFAAEVELQKQIKEVRQYWLTKLGTDE